MKTRSLACVLAVVCVAGCGSHPDETNAPTPPPAETPAAPKTPNPATPTGKQVRISGINKVNFPDGKSALVLEYETDIPIEDMESLRREVLEIWKRFQIDVEKAGVDSGVIRASHYEGKGWLRKGNGYGFLFAKGADGQWKLSDDKKTKALSARKT
jgi:hypothetical protein